MKITKGRSYTLAIQSGIICLGVVSTAFADMKSLDDAELSSVSGQSGITLEMDLSAAAGRLS